MNKRKQKKKKMDRRTKRLLKLWDITDHFIKTYNMNLNPDGRRPNYL